MTGILIAILVLLVPFIELVFAGSGLTLFADTRVIFAVALMLIVSKHPRIGITLVLVGTVFVELAAFRPIAGLDAIAFFAAAGLTSLLFRFSSVLSAENTHLQVAMIFIVSLVMRHAFLLASDQQSSQLSAVSVFANGVILIIALFIHARLKQPENAFKN